MWRHGWLNEHLITFEDDIDINNKHIIPVRWINCYHQIEIIFIRFTFLSELSCHLVQIVKYNSIHIVLHLFIVFLIPGALCEERTSKCITQWIRVGNSYSDVIIFSENFFSRVPQKEYVMHCSRMSKELDRLVYSQRLYFKYTSTKKFMTHTSSEGKILWNCKIMKKISIQIFTF